MVSSKFDYNSLKKLTEHLSGYVDVRPLTLSFHEIETIIETELPAIAKGTNARQVARWWYNSVSSKQAKFWMDVGFETCECHLISVRNNVSFERISDCKIYKMHKNGDVANLFVRFWDALSSKNNPDHQRAIAIISIISIFISITAIGVPLVLHFGRTPVEVFLHVDDSNNFANLMEQSHFELTNRNFIQSARYANQAYHVAIGVHEQSAALYYEGMNYLLYGLFNSCSVHFANAIEIHQEIVHSSEFIGTHYYIDAIIDIISAMHFLGMTHEDPLLVGYIELLREYHQFGEGEHLNFDTVSLDLKVATTLGLFYHRAYESSIFNIFANPYLERALYYYEHVYRLRAQNTEILLFNRFYEDDWNVAYRIANFTLNYHMFQFPDDAFGAFENALNLVQDAITQVNSNSNREAYIRLLRTIGKAYVCLALLSRDGEHGTYFEEAYNNLRILIHWPIQEYEIEYQIVLAFNYLLFTGMCSSDDLSMILDRLTLISSLNYFDIDERERARFLLAIYTTYRSHLHRFDYREDEIYDLIINIMDELNTTLYSFMSERDRVRFRRFRDGDEEYNLAVEGVFESHFGMEREETR
jgi:hypothetical protein